MFAPAAKVVCGELGEQLNALMLPTLTLGTQVAAVAGLALMLVQVAVKLVMTCAGLTTVGVVAPRVACMSEALAVTSTLAVSQIKPVLSQTLYKTLQLPLAGTL